MRRVMAGLVVAICWCETSWADGIVLVPDAAVLEGPHASQRFLVERERGGLLVEDMTSQATFSIDNSKVAQVSERGNVTPVGDGVAVLTVRAGGESSRATVTVKKAKADVAWSFTNHVEPVMTRLGCNAGSCHGAAAGKNGFRLTLRGYGPEVDYDVLTRQAIARRINKTAPAESLFLLKPTGALEHGGGVRLEPESLEYRVLADWIGAGMPKPTGDEPHVKSVSALPTSVRMEPGQTQQVLVQARYSDGTVADVTRWAKFETTDATVARVDEHGLVKVEGHGEASINIWFASLVDRTSVIVPSTKSVDAGAFASAPRMNMIDDKNLAKLQALGIPPSGLADDATFLRRASLDATGRLPSVEEVTSYLGDSDSNKQQTLIERLLNSDAFVDYWTYKWSDLLLVSSKNLPVPAMWSFSRFIRQSVAENVPWDRFVRKIVTAKGSTLANGAANYFVLHKDPVDLTESASMAFLGLSLTCARCHNHPMEKWTQDQYYGMANLFSRVTLKDGQGAGDVVVASASEGEILHPRKGVAMAPQPLDGKSLSLEERADRREAFADWLASPENPYFDRAIVNRVWRNFFGRGLIDPEDDLRATNPPSDEDLLEWLVKDFRSHQRDIKHLIRTIMNSGVYGRSSEPVPGNAHDVKYGSHYVVKRMPAEVMLDAIAQVTEVPTAFAGFPAGYRSLQLPDVKVENRFLDSFGRPERVSTCSCERSAEPSITQALHLSNGDTINLRIKDDKGAAARLATSSKNEAEILDHVFKAALGRPPNEAERKQLVPVMAEAADGLSEIKEVADARRQAIEDLFWATLTSKEFLFNH